ncbi:MAG: ABC transporter ATP-binding protein/permease [Treponema sp.]|jgi:ATP-binding cassette subfamily B protein|nr:ABC transporter ATP-binding protein/permease [Treponema sp.]
MSDYFEVEEASTKGFDKHIVRRILSYIKPYRLLTFLTITALAVSTVGELLLPVLLQRVIDNAILAQFLVIDDNAFDAAKEDIDVQSINLVNDLKLSENAVRISDYHFIPRGSDLILSGKSEQELRLNQVILSEKWYALSFDTVPDARNLVLQYPNLFISNEEFAAIRTDDLYTLSAQEILTIRGKDTALIISIVTVSLIVLVLVFLFSFIQTWCSSLIGQKVMKDLRLELFKKTSGQSTDFLSRHPVGRIVTRLTGDVETINEFFTSVLVAFLKDFSIMAGVLVTLFLLSPRLALALFITMPPVFIASAISRVKARDAFRRQRAASSQVNSYLSERLSGVQVVQLFSGEEKSSREFRERNHELFRANLGEIYVFATFRPVIDFLSTLTVAIVVTLGSAMILNLSLSIGVLIVFVSLVQMFYAPVQDIAEKYTLLQSAMAGGERVFTLLDTDESIPNTGKHSIEGMVRGHIEFDDVHFSYKAGEEILKGLSFTVEPGETIAIVGYTGAGKTTITNVLARLWDIDSGMIKIDGVPIKDIPLQELRRSVLPVLQDVVFFSGTILDNIRLGLDLSDEEVEEAAKAVYAHEFISKLPDGYNTLLSEGATNISSGQRQLISFARVIAQNPAIVVLDEATSSIDTETEHYIQMGIQQILKGRTSIAIAHRLSTIRNSDQILVLSGGHLAEKGCHQDLIDADGLYANLYKLQYSEQ